MVTTPPLPSPSSLTNTPQSYYPDPSALYAAAMASRGGRPRRFDEYYRVYPTAMMQGPDRPTANHGGKIFLPASALDKLTQLHITYPMLFELHNGAAGRVSHAGVLEFTAEEGRCYLPWWLMQVLGLGTGDLGQVKSTDIPLGRFVKLQPQSVNFLEISDPKAVLETAFRNFSCLTVGDVFTFEYNDTVYEIAVLEVKPDDSGSHAISVVETDLEVDFAPPVGYVEPTRLTAGSGTSTPRSIGSEMAKKGGVMHTEGTMAQAINYSSIAPSADTVAKGHAKVMSHFSGSGQKLVASKKGKSSLASTPVSTGTSTPVPGATSTGKTVRKQQNGPQPLRLPPGKLFFGYEIKPLQNKDKAMEDDEQGKKTYFSGEGNTLRKKK